MSITFMAEINRGSYGKYTKDVIPDNSTFIKHYLCIDSYLVGTRYDTTDNTLGLKGINMWGFGKSNYTAEEVESTISILVLANVTTFLGVGG